MIILEHSYRNGLLFSFLFFFIIHNFFYLIESYDHLIIKANKAHFYETFATSI